MTTQDTPPADKSAGHGRPAPSCYRLLQYNEKIHAHDQRLKDDAETWENVETMWVGRLNKPFMQPIRRIMTTIENAQDN